MSEGTGDHRRRIETESIDVPPPPQRGGMGRGWKIALIGCGGVALLGLLLVGGCFAVVGTVASKGGDSKSKEDAPTATIGETMEVGDVAWQITGANQANQLTAQFADPMQGNFVIVDFNFTNNGNEVTTLDNESLVLIDGEGRESKTEADYTRYVPKDRNVFLERVNPGVTQQGQAIFEVAPGASGFRIEAGDTKAFEDINGYVELGF